MGTGEVTRHLGIDGSGRVAKAVLIGAIPFLPKTDDHPEASTEGSSTDQGRGGRGGSIDPVIYDPWRLTLGAVRAGGGMLTGFVWEVHHEPASSGHP